VDVYLPQEPDYRVIYWWAGVGVPYGGGRWAVAANARATSGLLPAGRAGDRVAPDRAGRAGENSGNQKGRPL
jgi:hypothetical protein